MSMTYKRMILAAYLLSNPMNQVDQVSRHLLANGKRQLIMMLPNNEMLYSVVHAVFTGQTHKMRSQDRTDLSI